MSRKHYIDIRNSVFNEFMPLATNRKGLQICLSSAVQCLDWLIERAFGDEEETEGELQ